MSKRNTTVIPRWKYLLSHIAEIPIESAESDINPGLYVSLRQGRLQLCTDNAVYSYEDRYDNFRLLFDQIDWQGYHFEEALILGLGLGSVPLLMEMAEIPVQHMTFVEIDECVIELAEKYVLPKLTTPYSNICVDGFFFLQLTEDQYNFIVSDIFIDDVIPDEIQSEQYLIQLKERLSPDGVLIINTLASTDEDKKLSTKYFETTFLNVFPDGERIHVWENNMLINRPLKKTEN